MILFFVFCRNRIGRFVLKERTGKMSSTVLRSRFKDRRFRRRKAAIKKHLKAMGFQVSVCRQGIGEDLHTDRRQTVEALIVRKKSC